MPAHNHGINLATRSRAFGARAEPVGAIHELPLQTNRPADTPRRVSDRETRGSDMIERGKNGGTTGFDESRTLFGAPSRLGMARKSHPAQVPKTSIHKKSLSTGANQISTAQDPLSTGGKQPPTPKKQIPTSEKSISTDRQSLSSLGMDFLSLGKDSRSVGMDFLSLGKDNRRVGMDFLSLGMDSRSLGKKNSSLARDFRGAGRAGGE
jgi:hypothetical protein